MSWRPYWRGCLLVLTISSLPDRGDATGLEIDVPVQPVLCGRSSFVSRGCHLTGSYIFRTSFRVRRFLASLSQLPSFAMWLVFPTSDYYDGSDTLSPHRPQLVQAFVGQVTRVSNVHNTVRLVHLSLGCLSTPVHYSL